MSWGCRQSDPNSVLSGTQIYENINQERMNYGFPCKVRPWHVLLDVSDILPAACQKQLAAIVAQMVAEESQLALLSCIA